LPFQGVAKLLLDCVLLTFEKSEERFRLVTRDVEFGSNLVLWTDHNSGQIKAVAANRHPGLRLWLLIAGNRPPRRVKRSVQGCPILTLHHASFGQFRLVNGSRAACATECDQSLGLETTLNFGAAGESPIRQSSTSKPKKRKVSLVILFSQSSVDRCSSV